MDKDHQQECEDYDRKLTEIAQTLYAKLSEQHENQDFDLDDHIPKLLTEVNKVLPELRGYAVEQRRYTLTSLISRVFDVANTARQEKALQNRKR